MATYNKYQSYIEKLHEAVIDWQSHTFKVALSNTAPNLATHDERADITELGAGNGYSSGGNTTTISGTTQSAGTYKPIGSDVVFTASGGSIGPFRYAVLYDDTATGDPLVAEWDYGSSITLANGESFTVDFDGTNGLFSAA